MGTTIHFVYLVLTAVAGPFITTIGITLLTTVYMVLGPAHWLKKLMQLTKMSWDYELFLLGLGAAYLAVALGSEKFAFQPLARLFGKLKQRISRNPKKRKQYKVIQEWMRA
jgi:cation-transporting P-type ATPase 13A2